MYLVAGLIDSPNFSWTGLCLLVFIIGSTLVAGILAWKGFFSDYVEYLATRETDDENETVDLSKK